MLLQKQRLGTLCTLSSIWIFSHLREGSSPGFQLWYPLPRAYGEVNLKKDRRGMGRQLSGKSTCYTSLRPWMWTPSTGIKSQLWSHVSIVLALLEGCWRMAVVLDPGSKRDLASKNKASSSVHICANTPYTHAPTLTHTIYTQTQTRKRKVKK